MNKTEMQDIPTADIESKNGKHTKEKEASGKPESDKKEEGITPKFGGGSFSTYFLYRGNGTVRFNCTIPGVNANSRIVAAISEYSTDSRANRFVGDAYMLIYNVAPYNGGVVVRFNVGWNGPLNVRVDLLIDP